MLKFVCACINYSTYNGITTYNHRNIFNRLFPYGRVVTYVTTDSTLTGVGKYAQDLYVAQNELFWIIIYWYFDKFI